VGPELYRRRSSIGLPAVRVENVAVRGWPRGDGMGERQIGVSSCEEDIHPPEKRREEPLGFMNTRCDADVGRPYIRGMTSWRFMPVIKSS
jgi:hypothetical protein